MYKFENLDRLKEFISTYLINPEMFLHPSTFELILEEIKDTYNLSCYEFSHFQTRSGNPECIYYSVEILDNDEDEDDPFTIIISF